MKIGLLTVYFADFGSYYQAAALQKYLISLGHSCELINDDRRAVRSPRLALGKIGTAVLPQAVLRQIAARVDMYRAFLTLKKDVDELCVSPSALRIGPLSGRYDCIVVGSDELWSATNKNTRFIPENFGIGLSCPVISYATSGITLHNPPQKMMRKIAQGLRTFRAISVRDRITAEWVGEILQKDIDVVLDPTLLNPFFVGKKIQAEPYILVYGEHFSDNQIRAMRAFAAEKDLPLCGVVWKHAWCDRDLQLRCAADLQNYFRSCAYAFSSTFHGTIFSIVNHAPFTSFTTQLRGKKVACLLEQLGLQSRLFDDESGEINQAPIDYDAVDDCLEQQRIRSRQYLENALNMVRNEV